MGCIVELELEEIKQYPRYTLYQVYKIDGDKKVPLYQETFTRWQIRRIEKHNNWLGDVKRDENGIPTYRQVQTV